MAHQKNTVDTKNFTLIKSATFCYNFGHFKAMYYAVITSKGNESQFPFFSYQSLVMWFYVSTIYIIISTALSGSNY